MQQSPRPQTNSASSKPLNLITTEQIQKHLDENKNLILAILENQRLGKMAECSKYQAILQKNLMYLAAIADAQPPGSVALTPTPTSSVTSQGNLQTQPVSQGNPPILHTQAPSLQQQVGTPIPKLPFQLNAHRPQDQQQQQQMLQYQQQQQMLQYQQQQQMLQYQQQQQQQMLPQFGHGGGVNAGMHLFKQQRHGSPSSPMDSQGNQPGGGSRPASDGSQGNSRLGPYQGSG